MPIRARFDGTLIAAGAEHTCAWSAADGLRCWGSNVDGQLDGIPQQAPVHAGELPLGAARVVELALGQGHSCATIELSAGLRETRCWGRLPLVAQDLETGAGARPPRVVETGGALPGEPRPLLRSIASSACVGDLCYGLNYSPPDRGQSRAGVRVQLPEGLSGHFLLGGRRVCAQGAGTDLRCAALTGSACSYERLAGLLGPDPAFQVCQQLEFGNLTEPERGWLPVIGLPARPRQTAIGHEFACGTIDRRIWCWGHFSWLSRPAVGDSFAPVHRSGAIEPTPTVALRPDSTRPCPAYVVASVSLLDPSSSTAAGHWGLDLQLTDGNRYLNGGLNFGGYGSASESVPGYAAFSIQNPIGSTQGVHLDLSGDGGEFEVTVESTSPPSTTRTLVLRETLVLAKGPTRRSLVLPNGFHIVGLQPTSGNRLFLAAVGTTQLDGGPAAFQGGAVVGGYLAGERTGFAGICTADASAVQLRTQARSTRDAAGAGDLRLRVVEGISGAVLYDSE